MRHGKGIFGTERVLGRWIRAGVLAALLIASPALAQTAGEPSNGSGVRAPFTLIPLDGAGELGDPIEVRFNPTEYTFDRAVPWEKHKSSKGDAPSLEFTDAEPRTLDVELFFDSYDEGGDVRALTSMIVGLAEVDSTLGRPPVVRLIWGKALDIQAVITSLSIRFTHFLADGTPVRATMNLTLTEQNDPTPAPADDEQ